MNVSVLVYGGSGSGKTYTIQGGMGEQGVLQQVLQEIYKRVNISVKLSYYFKNNNEEYVYIYI